MHIVEIMGQRFDVRVVDSMGGVPALVIPTRNIVMVSDTGSDDLNTAIAKEAAARSIEKKSRQINT